MKIPKALSYWLLWLPATLLVFFIAAVSFNSFGCNYELKIKSPGVDYQGVCRWGLLSAIEEERATQAKWQVHGWQLIFMDQMVIFVSSRKQLNKGTSRHSALNTYNQLQSDYSIVNYAWLQLTDDHIAIFQKTPHWEIILAQHTGWFSFYDRLFPRTPLIQKK